MMEICIAIGLGLWFMLAGIVSTIAVFKSFKVDEKREEK